MGLLPAGARDRRLKLLRAQVAQGELADVETWQTFATVWASKRDVSDRERVAAAEVAAEITTRFQILWSSTVAGLTPRDRCQCDQLIYDILAVRELGRREGIEITAAARIDLR